MAGSAGFTNAAAFLAVGTFVTHVTGFASLFGVHAAEADFKEAAIALVVPLFFLVGALVAGLLVGVREERGQFPHYDWVMVLSGISVLVTPALAWAGHLGTFENGFHLSLQQNAVILASLCMASGMQNAALSSATQHSVRITHLSGLTTDLGLALARLLGVSDAGRRSTLLRLSAVRSGTIAAFLIGSLAGAAAAYRFGFNSFLLPAAICFYAALRGRQEKFMTLLKGRP